jgi:GT2 family glycosyltransferase/glycosyltransferase involved in cell wall biosynthesis
VKVDSTHLAKVFERVSNATDNADHVEALRLADSARRLAPAHPDTRLVYARALINDGRAAAAAECLAGREDPEGLVLHAEAAQAAGRGDDAIRICCLALTRFAVDTVPGLAALAGRLCRADPERFPGWMGLDSALRLVGELTGVPAAIVNWCNASIGRIGVRPDTAPQFSVDVPAHLEPGTLKVRAGDSELLGSGLRWPLDFRHEGWVVLEQRRLFGRVGLSWAPQVPLTVIVGPGRGERRIRLEPALDHAVDRPFEIELHDLDLDRDTLEVVVALPDGRFAPLAGSPLKLPSAVPRRIEPLPAYVTVPTPGRPARRPVNIVIPVFAGLKETLDCLRSVVATAPPSAVITVVDDMTPDAELRDALENAARRGLFTLVRNTTNLGFPGAANRGLRLHRDRDVILLNADTEVYPGWVERLGAAAYGGEHIGTVTPFGESGSILTYASRPSEALSAADAARADTIARRVNAHQVVDLPVGVGFCLYLRRACLNDAGEFDELGFGRGYGEENDLCLRARRRGWRHVAATDVFVRHVGGRSYGKERETLRRRNELVLNYRHPGYASLVAEFSSRDPLRAARRALDEQWLTEIAVKPVLLLSLELSGGVKRHVAERRAAFEAAGHTVLLLRAEAQGQSKTQAVRIEALRFEYLGYTVPLELAELRALLRQLSLTRIEIHHFLGLPGEVLDLVIKLSVPYQVFIHDYVWVCPRVTLLNGKGVYCGEPAIDACEDCVRTHGSNLGEELTVAELRLRSGKVLGNAERVVVPTQDVRQRMLKYFPSIDPVVDLWEGPVVRPRRPRRPRRAGPVRVALLGAIGTKKGHAVLLDCAQDAARRDLPVEFVVVGYSMNDPLWATGRVFVTGPYEESEVAALLEREECDVAWFPTVGPETWCYALTHALAAGLPVVAFDLGAVAERVRAAGTGVLLPLDTPTEQINAELLRIGAAERPSDAKPRSSDAKPIQDARPMDMNSVTETADPSAQLSATVQLLTLSEGLYAFTVQSGGTDAPTALRLPALQVGLAPLRSAGTVEFLCGPTTVDRWLTAGGDVVTVRIAGGEAALLLTSVRSATSGVLAIDVRRLDGTPVALPAAAPAPAAPFEVSPEVPSTDPRVIALVHVPYLGDLTFVAGWAGKPSENLWIEAFSVIVERPEGDPVLEYCGVSEDGKVSEWLAEGELCGARGRGVPLIAFALRVRAEAHGEYLCRYRGRFLSGAVIGPFDDGRFCRSEAPGDPLVALELTLEPLVAAPMVKYAG